MGLIKTYSDMISINRTFGHADIVSNYTADLLSSRGTYFNLVRFHEDAKLALFLLSLMDRSSTMENNVSIENLKDYFCPL